MYPVSFPCGLLYDIYASPYCLFPGWAWSLAKGYSTVEWLCLTAPPPRTKILTTLEDRQTRASHVNREVAGSNPALVNCSLFMQNLSKNNCYYTHVWCSHYTDVSMKHWILSAFRVSVCQWQFLEDKGWIRSTILWTRHTNDVFPYLQFTFFVTPFTIIVYKQWVSTRRVTLTVIANLRWSLLRTVARMALHISHHVTLGVRGGTENEV